LQIGKEEKSNSWLYGDKTVCLSSSAVGARLVSTPLRGKIIIKYAKK
jgi:hypothetical protein